MVSVIDRRIKYGRNLFLKKLVRGQRCFALSVCLAGRGGRRATSSLALRTGHRIQRFNTPIYFRSPVHGLRRQTDFLPARQRNHFLPGSPWLEVVEDPAEDSTKSGRIPRTVQTHQKDWKRKLCLSLPRGALLRQAEICREGFFQIGRLQRVERKGVPHKINRDHAPPQRPSQHEALLGLRIR